jgi:hypothetical protein
MAYSFELALKETCIVPAGPARFAKGAGTLVP